MGSVPNINYSRLYMFIYFWIHINLEIKINLSIYLFLGLKDALKKVDGVIDDINTCLEKIEQLPRLDLIQRQNIDGKLNSLAEKLKRRKGHLLEKIQVNVNMSIERLLLSEIYVILVMQ